MKKPKAPRLVTIFVMTTITIVFWIFVSLYSILTTKATLPIPPELLNPLNPTLDTMVLNDLTGKIFFEPGQTSSLASGQPSLSITPTPTPVVDFEEELEPPVATDEGETIIP